MSKFATIIAPRGDLDWCWYLRKNGTAGETMERALHEIGVMHPGGWANWQDSTLTDTGAPVAVQFSPRCDITTLMTEVDDPGRDPRDRLATACAMITRLGFPPVPGIVRNIVATAQGDSALRFGAWLGLGLCAPYRSAILHAECPASAADLAGLITSQAVREGLQALGSDVTIDRISVDTTTAATTLGGQSDRALAETLPALAAIARVPVGPLAKAIESMLAAGGTVDGVLEQTRFSLTTGPDAGTPRLSLHLPTKTIFGDDDLISGMVRAYPGDHHRAYAGLADMLPPAPRGRTHHGDVSLQAQAEGRPLLSIAVAAPWHTQITAD